MPILIYTSTVYDASSLVTLFDSFSSAGDTSMKFSCDVSSMILTVNTTLTTAVSDSLVSTV